MHPKKREDICICFDQCVCRFGRSLTCDKVIDIQPAESIRKPSDHGDNTRRTFPNIASRNVEFQFYYLRTRVRCIRDEGLSWRWELLAFTVNEAKIPESVVSQQDVGDVVSGERTALKLYCLQCSGMGVDGFLDASSFIIKYPSSDFQTFDGGRGKRLQNVRNRGCLCRLIVVIYLELLDVR